MANRTAVNIQQVVCTTFQGFLRKSVHSKAYSSFIFQYFELKFLQPTELLVDKAMELRAIGGVYGGNIKPTPFLCLILKMLQIQPEKDIIIEFIKQDEFKYVRCLGAFYLRLVYGSLDAYKYLEPLLNDYRKLRLMNRAGQYYLAHVDEFIDGLLREERVNDIILPRIGKRWVHEANNELEGRVSLLDDDLDDLESESDDDDVILPPPRPPQEQTRNRDDRHRGHSPFRRSPGREREREREKRHRSRSRERERGMDYGRGMERERLMDRERIMERDRVMVRDRGIERERVERKRHRSRSREKKRRSRSPGHHHREQDRMHGERDREREHRRDRGERGHREDRDHVRERNREQREHGEHVNEKEHRDRGERKKEKHHRSGRSKKESRSSHNMSKEDLEIAEANALRAQLGIPSIRL
ncbi:unnamed protein product, partial [Meganyctiphanes norvegica]